MRRVGDTAPYRGIEFGVHEERQGVWRWPKIGERIAKRGQIKESREDAIAACI